MTEKPMPLHSLDSPRVQPGGTDGPVHENLWSEAFTTKNALALAGGAVALGLAVRYAPAALGSVFKDAGGTLGRDALAGGREEALSFGRAIADTRLRLPSFASVKPTGRVDGALSGEAEAAMQKVENTPSMVAVQKNSWLAQTYEKVKPSVVAVQTEGGRARGSAFFIDGERQLLGTDHHVVAGLEKQGLSVKLTDGRSFPAHVIGFDESADVAILKVANNPAVRFDALKLGDPLAVESKRAAAMGFPQTGDGAPVIAPGAFKHAAFTDQSRLHLSMKTFFGQSGGPIVDRQWNVIGMVKNGVEAGEHSGPTTIASNVEHLRTLLNVVRDREIAQGPLSIDTEILARGRKMLSTSDILGLRSQPALAAKLRQDLTVRILDSSPL